MPNLKTKLKIVKTHGSIFTGGSFQVSTDGDYLFCSCDEKVNVIRTTDGEVETAFHEEDESIMCFVLSPDDEMLVIAYNSLLFRQWRWKEKILVRTWKSNHAAPVRRLLFDPSSTLMASGSSDGTVKVWDLRRQYCTHNLRGHPGVVSCLCFYQPTLQLLAAADDYVIRVWDLSTSECSHRLDGHFSAVTAIESAATHRSDDDHVVVSASRDQVVIVWRAPGFTKQATIPVFQSVESLALPSLDHLPAVAQSDVKDRTVFLTAGQSPELKIWDGVAGRCLISHSLAPSCGQQVSFVHMHYRHNTGLLYMSTFDHDIVMLDLRDLTVSKQFVGHNDQLLDAVFLRENRHVPSDTHLVLAVNSASLRLLHVTSLSCHLVPGHTDTVLALATSQRGDILVSASKDNTFRLWRLVNSSLVCLASCFAHASSVNAVCLGRLTTSFVVTAGQDCLLKVWKLPDLPHHHPTKDDSKADTSAAPLTLTASMATEKAHGKELSCVDVSVNDQFVVSGSQDKLVKLWSLARDSLSLRLVGVLQGHRRGVYAVKFSPVDQCVASCSGDGAVRVWSMSDLSCVKTFEGHDASVLRISFLSDGMQLVSTGSDGLVKLWNVRSDVCVQTTDAHDGPVWALAIAADETHLVTGGTDSRLQIWTDVTEEEQLETHQRRDEAIQMEQSLLNLLSKKRFSEAVSLAISLDQPQRLLKIIREILVSAGSEAVLSETMGNLRSDQLDAVLRYIVKWNTNSKYCHEANICLEAIFHRYSVDELLKVDKIRNIVEGLLPYIERHVSRLNRLRQQSSFVNYLWISRKPVPRTSDAPTVSSISEVEDASRRTGTKSSSGNDRSIDVSSVPRVYESADLEDFSIELVPGELNVNGANGPQTELTNGDIGSKRPVEADMDSNENRAKSKRNKFDAAAASKQKTRTVTGNPTFSPKNRKSLTRKVRKSRSSKS